MPYWRNIEYETLLSIVNILIRWLPYHASSRIDFSIVDSVILPRFYLSNLLLKWSFKSSIISSINSLIMVKFCCQFIFYKLNNKSYSIKEIEFTNNWYPPKPSFRNPKYQRQSIHKDLKIWMLATIYWKIIYDV